MPKLFRPIAQRLAQAALVTFLAALALVGLVFSILCFPLTAILRIRAKARGNYPQYRVVRWHIALVTVWGASCAMLLEYPNALRNAAKRFDY